MQGTDEHVPPAVARVVLPMRAAFLKVACSMLMPEPLAPLLRCHCANLHRSVSSALARLLPLLVLLMHHMSLPMNSVLSACVAMVDDSHDRLVSKACARSHILLQLWVGNKTKAVQKSAPMTVAVSSTGRRNGQQPLTRSWGPAEASCATRAAAWPAKHWLQMDGHSIEGLPWHEHVWLQSAPRTLAPTGAMPVPAASRAGSREAGLPRGF